MKHALKEMPLLSLLSSLSSLFSYHKVAFIGIERATSAGASDSAAAPALALILSLFIS